MRCKTEMNNVQVQKSNIITCNGPIWTGNPWWCKKIPRKDIWKRTITQIILNIGLLGKIKPMVRETGVIRKGTWAKFMLSALKVNSWPLTIRGGMIPSSRWVARVSSTRATQIKIPVTTARVRADQNRCFRPPAVSKLEYTHRLMYKTIIPGIMNIIFTPSPGI